MSTLYVDNLQPNLGNAVHAAGHVVQVQSAQGSTQSQTSTGGVGLTGATMTFVPKFSNSKLIITSRVPVKFNKGTDTAAWASVYLEVDGTRISPNPAQNYEMGINFGDLTWSDFRQVGYVQALYEPSSLPASLVIAVKAVGYSSNQTITINESTHYKSHITAMEIAQ